MLKYRVPMTAKVWPAPTISVFGRKPAAAVFLQHFETAYGLRFYV